MTWADMGWLILAIVIFIGFITIVVLGLTYGERKIIARFQQRLGPTRTGPFGLLQPVADALKLLAKEDFIPGSVDRLSFWIAPIVVFVPAFIAWVTIPFTRDIVISNMEFGIFYILAVSGLSTAGLLMAGWGSFNKYAMLGAVRSAAQLISYELPLVVGVLGVVMISGSLDLKVIVAEQDGLWFAFMQPIALVLFLIAGLAEVARAPFDIPVAESEVVGGPFVEYSGMHWSMFSLAEYANTFAVAVLATILFLGGWRGPGPDSGWGQDVMMAFWFLLKTSLVLLAIFWVRATVPRLRIDQLMSLAWVVLLPLAFVNMILTAFYLYYDWPDWTMVAISFAVLAAIGIAYQRRRVSRLATIETAKVRVRQGKVVA
ncbi:MAG: NADH-quinone oxidoreductase subunit NuoH [Chloroflexi bacterium]|nr:NADH-quinone oxidoreductase subunit NuoH [Chloroflexota bacterium]